MFKNIRDDQTPIVWALVRVVLAIFVGGLLFVIIPVVFLFFKVMIDFARAFWGV